MKRYYYCYRWNFCGLRTIKIFKDIEANNFEEAIDKLKNRMGASFQNIIRISEQKK